MMRRFLLLVLPLLILACLVAGLSCAPSRESIVRGESPKKEAAAAIEDACAREGLAHEAQPGCFWEPGERTVCQGILRTYDREPPPPERICVCHKCRDDRDCLAQGGGQCLLRESRCSAAVRICVHPDNPCALCPGACTKVRNPQNNKVEALCQPEPPVP